MLRKDAEWARLGKAIYTRSRDGRRHLTGYRNARGERLDWHALRHSCATLLAQSGVDIRVAQRVIGIKDIRVLLEVYEHHELAPCYREMAKLPIPKMAR